MANPNAPFGLRPSRSLGHSNTQVNEYVHPASNGTAIFIGDSVTSDSSTPTSSVPYPAGSPLVLASGSVTTGYIRGAAVGVRPTLTNLSLQYCPASTLLGVLVADDPYQLFDIQDDGTVLVADVGTNIAITSGSGNTSTGISAYVAHEATTGASEVLRIMRLAPIVNNLLGQYGVLEVLINNHELRNTAQT